MGSAAGAAGLACAGRGGDVHSHHSQRTFPINAPNERCCSREGWISAASSGKKRGFSTLNNFIWKQIQHWAIQCLPEALRDGKRLEKGWEKVQHGVSHASCARGLQTPPAPQS